MSRTSEQVPVGPPGSGPLGADPGGAADAQDAPPGPVGPEQGRPRSARSGPGVHASRTPGSSRLRAGHAEWVFGASAVALVLCVVVFGSLVALRAPVWAPVDEGAHFEYVQYIAQHGSLPVLGKQYASLRDLKLDPTFSTRHWGTDPRKMGILGLAYEDFQPPLYYALAVPAYDLSGNLHTKVIILRFFDLVLLGASMLLLARLARRVMEERWLIGFTAGMLVLAMPGVVVRAVTVSNTSLAVLLTIAFATVLWIARATGRASRLVAAGVLLGLALLTNLFALVLFPVYVLVAIGVVRRSPTRRDLVLAGGGGAIACLLVVPWLAFNLVEYHALTATSLAKSEQQATVNPHHLFYGLGFVADKAGSWLIAPVMPQEWTLADHPVLTWIVGLLTFAVVPLALLLGLSMGRRVVTAGYWILVLPAALNLLMCAGITYFVQWEIELSRYMYPTLPLLAVFGAVSAVAMVRDHRLIPVTVALLTVGMVTLWIGLVPQIHLRVAG